jgi:AcrR family transcriptional regulator
MSAPADTSPPGAATGRSGRRPGGAPTRDGILAAARREFAELGYDRATIRGIGARAGVDPALVLHYFGTKERLFTAALYVPVQPGEVVRRVMREDVAGMGAAVVRSFLDAWEPEDARAPLVAMVRSAMTNEVAMGLVRDYLGRRVFAPITRALGVPDAELRATLVGSQLVGLAMTRYVARLEPLASLDAAQVVAALAPTVQRYLTGEIGDPGGVQMCRARSAAAAASSSSADGVS